MLSFLLLFCMTSEFKHTSIFEPLHAEQIAVTSSGEVFIMDRNDRKIHRYDAQGNPLPKIGKANANSGEFQMLQSIKVFSNRLFVMDTTGVHEFDLKGNWLKDHTTVKRGTILSPSSNGFLARGNDFDMAAKQLATVFKWLDKDLVEIKMLGQSPMESNFPGPGAKEMKMSFNPAEAFANGLIDRTGHFLLFKGKESSKITIYSLTPEFKEVTTLNMSNRRPLPFNREWADVTFDRMTKHGRTTKTADIKMEWVTDYPTHFPVIQDIRVTSDNLIRVTFWSITPDKPTHSFYDWSGKEVQPKWSAKEQFRIVQLNDDLAYITSFDPENKDYGCVSVPIKDAAVWIKSNPYFKSRVIPSPPEQAVGTH